jgi:hypothetical protein
MKGGGEFSARSVRHFDGFLPRIGLTTLVLHRPHDNPFAFYLPVAVSAIPECLAADAFRSVTSLSTGPTEMPWTDGGAAPEWLSLLFPSLTHLAALPNNNNWPSKPRHGDDRSQDVHQGLRALDLGGTEMSDDAVRLLSRRFPLLETFVAPAAATASTVLLATIVEWRDTLATLDLSCVVDLHHTGLASLLVGPRGSHCRLALGLATFRRLRLASRHRPLYIHLCQLLAQRVAASPVPDDGGGGGERVRIVVEWVSAARGDTAAPVSASAPFAGF